MHFLIGDPLFPSHANFYQVDKTLTNTESERLLGFLNTVGRNGYSIHLCSQKTVYAEQAGVELTEVRASLPPKVLD